MKWVLEQGEQAEEEQGQAEEEQGLYHTTVNCNSTKALYNGVSAIPLVYCIAYRIATVCG